MSRNLLMCPDRAARITIPIPRRRGFLRAARPVRNSVILSLVALLGCGAGLGEEETSWEHAPSSYKTPADLVKGGAFIDRIEPMPVTPGDVRSDVWGGDNVKPRNVNNGIEDPKWSYWCMSVHPMPDGKEHMFGARWPESAPKGHMSWSGSHAFHAVADSPLGPFRVVEEDIGEGHNVTLYRAKDGSFIIYRNGGGYIGPSINGPWKRFEIRYDTRGTHPGEWTNHKFVSREDGSVLMVSRSGRIWVSEDGIKPFRMISVESVYPKIKGNFEDPEIWRDEVQYHLIVNDWFGRSAYYLRSKDGVSWVWDQGLAYDPGVARHADGSREKWYKFERVSVRQDKHGRATHIYFAVIDSRKDLDLANDNHGSKIIALPLTVQRRMHILDVKSVSAGTTRLRVKVLAEPGFDPARDMDLEGLRFGAPSAVDYGKGMKVAGTARDGGDLIITFEGSGGFSPRDFVGKLLGSSASGGLVYGYTRLPGVDFIEPMVSAPPARFDGKGVNFRVENLGQVASDGGNITLSSQAGGAAKSVVRALPVIPPYGGADVSIPLDYPAFPKGAPVTVSTRIEAGGTPFEQRATLKMLSAPAGGTMNLEIASAIRSECGWGETRADRSVTNKDLRLGDKSFSKGYGTHAPAIQTWLLDGSFEWLSLRAGLDPSQGGSVTVEILGDGKRLGISPALRKDSPPHVMVVPLRGVRELSIVSSDAGDGNSADHINIVEPTLHSDRTKPTPAP